MRTSIAIPDALYVKLQVKAARDGISVRDVIVKLVRQEVEPLRRGNRIRPPLVSAKETRTLDITNAEINEILW